MPSIVKRKVRGKTYQYLRYTYREGGATKSIEVGITKLLERGQLQEAKEILLQRVFEARWRAAVDRLKDKHASFLASIDPVVANKFHEDFGIRFTHQTNKIEGSRLTFSDTRAVILDGMTPPGKPVVDVIEARKHMEVYREIVRHHPPVSRETLLAWHRAIFSDTSPDGAGSFRKSPVIITGSKHVPPASDAEVSHHLDELFEWLARHGRDVHPALLAIVIMYRLTWIHPFNDGNGRVSRLAMNAILHAHGYPMFSLDPAQRDGFYAALEKSDESGNEIHVAHWFFTRYLASRTRRERGHGGGER